MRWWPSLAAIALAAGGCLEGVTPVPDRPTLVLEYSLESLTDADRPASFGPHCGTARLAASRVEIEQAAYKTLGAQPFLVVRHEDAGGASGFYAAGFEGYPMSFPAVIDPHINGTSSPIATVDYRNGTARVDGQVVMLPHSWTREANGDWRATFTLRHGPEEVHLFTRENCA